MAYPSVLARTKDWGTEILTDTDLEGQFDLINTWINSAMNSSTGHKHDGTTSEGPKILTANIDDAAGTAGDVFYSDGTSITRLAIGTNGQGLTVNAGATAPEWTAVGTTFASAAEVKTGTESAKSVAPDTMIGHEGIAKGWIRFVGTGTISTTDSYNVSGIVDNGTGDYTVTWDNNFADGNYAVVVTSQATSLHFSRFLNSAAGSVDVKVVQTTTGSAVDGAQICLVATGSR